MNLCRKLPNQQEVSSGKEGTFYCQADKDSILMRLPDDSLSPIPEFLIYTDAD